MADFTVTIENQKAIRDYLDNLPEDTFTKAKAGFQVLALAADTQVKKNTTTKLKRRSGALARSIRTGVKGTNLANLTGSIYALHKFGSATVVYAPIHEYGGTIKAKNAYHSVEGGPFLNIPTDENKTAAGVQRLTARMVFQHGGYIAGKGVYLDGVKMFSLVKAVKIPARLGMRDAVDDNIPTLLSTLADQIGE